MGSLRDDDGIYMPVNNDIDVVNFVKVVVKDSKGQPKTIQMPAIASVNKRALS